MSHELPNAPGSVTIDVSGLPEPVVQSIQQLVDSLREEMPREESKAGPQRQPLRGRFADLKLSLSKEDLDAAQREAWAKFPREFPEAGKS
jgi:hypothetical protein